MSAEFAAVLADTLLVVHFAVVLFVLGVALAIPLGAVRRWRWVRHRGLRLIHLGAVVFIAVQSWLGKLCPLTLWEQNLRQLAGQTSHGQSFIGYWLSRLLYVDVPFWAFVMGYTVFALFVAACWLWQPPAPPRQR